VSWQTYEGTLCGPYEMVVSPCSIVQPIRPHHLYWRDTYLWRGQWFSCELRQGISGDGVEAMKIFLGWSWSQDGIKLRLQPRVVEPWG
jgi:hypothetical protein